jgi:LysR family glycine cleavage system transcriptional activator
MELDWLHFPPLTALRAFEATARHEGFSTAARALNVTHAAVAQQVRGLEDFLGLELVYRDGRSLRLTPEGERLAAALGEGFETIQGAIAGLRNGASASSLRVTMTPVFASQWLMPRLGKFWSAHPEVKLSLLPDRRYLDIRHEGIDLAIRFGKGSWPGLATEYLTAARCVVVGAPSMLGDRTSFTTDELAAMPWLIEEDWPEALVWLRGLGLPVERLALTMLPTAELAITAARQGYGLHVQLAALVESELAAGQLRILRQIEDPALAYYLVTRPGPQKPALRAFLRWLKASV